MSVERMGSGEDVVEQVPRRGHFVPAERAALRPHMEVPGRLERGSPALQEFVNRAQATAQRLRTQERDAVVSNERECSRIRKQAADQLRELQARAREEGRQGQQSAFEKGEHALAVELARLHGSFEHHYFTRSLALARDHLRKVAEGDSAWLIRLCLRTAMRRRVLRGAVFTVHESHAKSLEGRLPELEACEDVEVLGQPQIVGDPQFPRDGLRLETEDGVVEVSIDTHLMLLAEELEVSWEDVLAASRGGADR